MQIQDMTTWTEAFARRSRVDLGGDIASMLALGNATDIISFSGGFPDPAVFPGEALANILRDLIARGDSSAFQYAGTAGLPGPRKYVAERIGRLEGREPEARELILTSGGIDALALLAKTFCDPGDAVLVEAPTYLGAVMCFRSFEAEVRGVGMDEEGLRVDEVEPALAGGRRPKLLYTIPDHQNPAGVTLSPDRRSELVETARRHGMLVIEDVAYRELGFGGEPLPSLWSLGPDVVVQIGTFSKTFFPGVRLGWAVGPPDVIAQLVVAKQLGDQCAGPLGQRLLEEYGRRGLLDEQISRARELYARRCGLMLAALSRHMPEGVSWTRPGGGFFSWVTLPGSVDASDLAPKAMAGGVAYVPGTPFFPDGRGRNTLRLAFSKVDDDRIEEGIHRLALLFGEGRPSLD